MNIKFLLLTLSVAAFSSCSTSYKSGQTPDDVYFSPVRPDEDGNDRDEKKDDRRYEASNNRYLDYRITMGIRDRRWRDLDDEYDYSYRYEYSPYNYGNCYSYYGYYYNPYYNTWPVYNHILTPKPNTPRKVNLNAYTGYGNGVRYNNTKTASGVMLYSPSVRYNNSNNANARENLRRQNESYNRSATPSSNTNETRSYTPSSSSSSSSGSSNSSSSGSSGSVSRPNRGG